MFCETRFRDIVVDWHWQTKTNDKWFENSPAHPCPNLVHFWPNHTKSPQHTQNPYLYNIYKLVSRYKFVSVIWVFVMLRWFGIIVPKMDQKCKWTKSTVDQIWGWLHRGSREPVDDRGPGPLKGWNPSWSTGYIQNKFHKKIRVNQPP